jgi:hypothetical protein
MVVQGDGVNCIERVVLARGSVGRSQLLILEALWASHADSVRCFEVRVVVSHGKWCW